MAGASLSIDYQFDDRQVVELLDQITQQTDNMQPVFADIGEYLLLSHAERFEAQVDPDGNPWEPLDEKYKARKPKNQDLILILDGYLSGTLAYNASQDGLEFGTPRIQGASMHFGDPDRGIPARPWLGLSTDDEQEVLEILSDHLLG